MVMPAGSVLKQMLINDPIDPEWATERGPNLEY
ncbi:hypothetical protein SCAR479_02746 [Seiridium cardinale]|uniref:Uncharacterized protein n=1 Tax=Seiridium cardinale TaxID=138064 RepID=A0ABR2Y3V7_9PEZI